MTKPGMLLAMNKIAWFASLALILGIGACQSSDGSASASDELGEEIRQHASGKLGAIARPKTVVLVPDLPKTRSGKIMRRLLRDVVEGRRLGDTTTLADASVVEEIRTRAADAPQED